MQNSNHHSKVKTKKWGKFRWVFLSIFSRKNGSTDHQLKGVESDWIRNKSPSAIPPDSPLYKSYPFLKLLQMEDEEKQEKGKNLKPNKADKTVKVLSFSGIILKKLFIKTKSGNRTENKNGSSNNVGRIAEIVIGRQASVNSSVCRVASIRRAPSRIGSRRSRSQRLKMAQPLTKQMSSRRRSTAADRDESDELLTMVERGANSERECTGGEELCKKRILMGGKCRPLMGGILQYDTDGVLKPDLTV